MNIDLEKINLSDYGQIDIKRYLTISQLNAYHFNAKDDANVAFFNLLKDSLHNGSVKNYAAIFPMFKSSS